MLVVIEPLHGRAVIRTEGQAQCVLAVPRQSPPHSSPSRQHGSGKAQLLSGAAVLQADG